ncbi:restriction endonuclease subunit R [Deltaproteobacteria bacterium]|nr:restriction endonuclease subunit R [Deltaproteobacteria bacterium]
MNEGLMQSTNFEFLRPRWPELADLGGYAEHYIKSDPDSACLKSRRLAEHLALLACRALKRPIYDDNFLTLLRELEEIEDFPKVILNKFHQIRLAGNRAAHTLSKIKKPAQETVEAAFDLARWWVKLNEGPQASLPAEFQPPKPAAAPNTRQEQEQLARLKARTDELIAENEALRHKAALIIGQQEQAAFQDKSAQALDALKFDEAETRRRLIDVALLAAGWDVSDPDQVKTEFPVAGQNTPTGQGFADYVLFDAGGTALAVIEAKRTAENPKIGRCQAQGYAEALEKRNGGLRPLIFLSNGYEIWLEDDQGGPTDLPTKGYKGRQIYGFPSRDSLDYRVRFQRQEMKDPAKIPHNQEIANRPYQVEAIKAVAERFGVQRRRQALIVQATGTGKTRVAIALAELLRRSGFVKRILFLCDRKELRRQAKNAFTQFLPALNVALLGRTKDPAASVVLATYPAMMKRYQDYDVAWFDLVIADESHRSIYNKYRDLFLYFDAWQIGLTATPRHKVSHNTYKMFDCGDDDPTYYYEYDRAVDDGYLVDFTPIEVTTKFLREGIHADQLTEVERERLEQENIDLETLDIDPDQVNQRAYVKGTNLKILENLMQNGLRDATENGPGKSIIFARNHRHAELLGQWFQEMYPEFGPDYCAVIDNYNPRAEQLIDDFKKPGSNPVIAVSVDMLDTGVDMPEVLNLVFAKPVKSYVKFWQMVGRGTRLCPDLHGPGQDKKRFLLFDHWGNCEFFSQDRANEEPQPTLSLLERLFETRLSLAETALARYDRPAFDRTVPLIRALLRALPEDSLPVREKYRPKLKILAEGVLEKFEPATVETLRRVLAPLVKYVNIRGQKEAYQFDELIAKLSRELLAGSSLVEGLKGDLDNALAGLRLNLEPVKDKFDQIKSLREQNFWEQPQADLLAALEEKRQTLRNIMQYGQITTPRPTPEPLLLNLADADVQSVVREKLRPSPQDMRAYRQRVRAILEPHFQTDPTLIKLRHGEGLTDHDFEALTSLTLTQNNEVNLETLREFYPETEQLEQELRAIVGLEAETVKNRFSDFYIKYPTLNSNQIAFLNLLQKHIQDYGPIRLEKLYEAPFINLCADGPDGLFSDEVQFHDLLHILQSFDPPSEESPTPSSL